ncbi:HNH endonuclease [Rhizobium sp. L51/94]|uniref:HNH endonuclease n=1 Tax=Rhizobium sp. L51/94 TaxID=2819999 RepID=UPI001C5AF87A|nr:HNH endonuclease [Rhizobium sp. L51/94]QXZ79650.1 HNH endonuclease [Rhizobium sp. L51/94]
MGKLKTISITLRCIDARTVKVPTKQRGSDLYVSKDWHTLRDGLIAKRGRRCERCGRTKTRIFGDHIVELQDGGAPLDETNVELLCGSCHTEKTAAARAKRLAQRYS